jgi:acetyl esterase/lipase
MSIGTLFLIVSLWGALWTLAALVGPRRPALLSFPFFMMAWLTGDFVAFHIAWQAAATLLFGWAGAFETWTGQLGLAVTLASWLGMLVVRRRMRLAEGAVERSLHEALGADYRMTIDDPGDVVRARHPLVRRESDIPYGPHGERNLLDVYYREDRPANAPVLLWIHGGAWITGHKQQQGQPLIQALVPRGWVCVAINYRLSPAATFPEHLIDAKRAIAWIREKIGAYGGDASFIAVCGGSAGGHLASLVALTADEPEYQPGFEQADTSVTACVPMYGAFDFTDRHGIRGARADMAAMLEKQVLKTSRDLDRQAWEKASPIYRVRPDAPPFLVVHGTHDSLLWIEETRAFVDALRRTSNDVVAYAEIPYAQHAFDVRFTPQAIRTVQGVARFLEWVRKRPAGTLR